MMKNIFNWFKQRFGVSSDPGMENMLKMIPHTRERELLCDEVHALIDQFAEMKMRGEDPTRLMPFVQQHLDMCPDCREEYEALLEALHIDQQLQG
ncbi:MAG TPA: hypothetical protein VFZ43_12535 [Anaerolineales bacterium]